MARFGRLGIGPNGSFKAASLTPELRAAVEAGMADAWKQFEGFKRLTWTPASAPRQRASARASS